MFICIFKNVPGQRIKQSLKQRKMSQFGLIFFYNLVKSVFRLGQIYFAFGRISIRPTFELGTYDRKEGQFGLIHFTIWTNIFPHLDKSILQFGQINTRPTFEQGAYDRKEGN